MKIEQIMEKLQYLTVQEVENPKLEVEQLSKLSPYLHLDDYLTYIVFLQYRQDLPEYEKKWYLDLIEALKEKERQEYEEALKRFETKSN